MRDLNFNPGVGLGHLIVYHNKYIGHALFMLEHESNGKDGPASRSWNKVSLSSTLLLNRHMEMQLKAWIPIVDGENNRNILRYSGLAQMGLLYRTDNRRVQAGMLATWRRTPSASTPNGSLASRSAVTPISTSSSSTTTATAKTSSTTTVSRVSSA